MILFPAIDLKDGQCVRLQKGAMDAATVFNDDPAAQARDFAAQGFKWLHLVDLNGAIEGRPVNAAAVEAIVAATDLPAQLGRRHSRYGHDRGLARTRASRVSSSAPWRSAIPPWCARLAGVFPSASSSVSMRAVARSRPTAGVKTSETTASELAGALLPMPASPPSSTPISTATACSDGVNVEATAALAAATDIPVIASGGVASLDDLRALKKAPVPLAGVICGRALYDGRIDPGAGAGALLA